MKPHSPRLRLSSVPRAACVGIAVVAIAALVGWMVGNPYLKSLVPGLMAMNPGTAECFILLSASLWLLSGSPSLRAKRWGQTFAAVVAALAASKLAGIFLGIEHGFDTLLFRRELDAESVPNRMAPNTAAAFLLAGLSLILLDYETKRGKRPAPYLLLPVGLIAQLTLIGYAFNAGALARIAMYVPMALHTAALFMAFTLGVLAARPRAGWVAVFTSDTLGGRLSRKLFPVLFFVPLAVGWIAGLGKHMGFYGTGMDQAIYTLTSTVVLTAVIWVNARFLDKTDRERQEAAAALRDAHEELEQRVQDRTAELAQANAALQVEVDERAYAEAQIKEQQEFLRKVIDKDPNLIFVKDLDGRFTLANQALAKAYGTTVEGVVGKTDGELSSDIEEVEQSFEADCQVIRTMEDLFIPAATITDAAGNRRWLQTVKRPLMSADGRVHQVLGIASDITGRKEAESALRQSQERYRAFVAHSSEAIWCFDLETPIDVSLPVERQVETFLECACVAECNDTAARMYGFVHAHELIGMPLGFFFDADDAVHMGFVRSFISSGYRLEEVPSEASDEHGNQRYFIHSLMGIVENGQLVRAWSVQRDVTERKGLEAKVAQSEKLAALGEMVAGVVHEINNPLSAISANAQLIELHEDAKIQQRAQTIQRMTERATRIIRSLLTFARGDDGERRPCSLNAAVVGTLEVCEYKLRKADVELVLDLADIVPHAICNEHQIQQVILNLLNNAEHALRGRAGNDKRVTVKTGTTMAPDGREFSYISVADSGPGIPEEIRHRIFDPFFSTKGVGEGTGLGLSICHGIVEAHGGSLSLDSPGEGATFVLSLPAFEASQQAA